ncbi:DUF2971 domain-containing protein [Petrocella sp. FN5]|uniref:DUF2971 domain-containing protein n=1 Tax=Petrocella sp. FN5 TaxID=3032002 RepID=UPI0023DBF238|nr:DUF2971 domain-containing protein [Petrocella sp. FN5]MDF1617320.1 DUF2971 domain-containing protein [Petrocella sp. FN5]
MDLYYKYRTLENIEYFKDIIINKRLYAPKYVDLNDRWEGNYTHDIEVEFELTNAIKEIKRGLGIVSVSRNKNNTLMWSHYADGERGLVIGLKICDPIADIRDVIYKSKLPSMNEYKNLNRERFAREVLTHKLTDWEYEEEVRVFVEGRSFVKVKLFEIIAGARMPEDKFVELVSLVKELDSTIKVRMNE